MAYKRDYYAFEAELTIEEVLLSSKVRIVGKAVIVVLIAPFAYSIDRPKDKAQLFRDKALLKDDGHVLEGELKSFQL